MNNFLSTLICGAALMISVSASGKTITASKNYVTKPVKTEQFSAIATTSSVNVKYSQSPVTKIEIYAPDNIIDYVDVRVSGNTLTVGYKSGSKIYIRGNNKTEVRVSAPSVTQFNTQSSGDIDIVTTLNAKGEVILRTGSSGDIEAGDIICNTLNAKTGSSGDIEVASVKCVAIDAMTGSSGDIELKNVSAKTVNASTASSGDIKISGTCDVAELTTKSSGDIEARNLKAVNVKASTLSSGDISCYATGNRDIRKNSLGDIHCR